MGANRYRSVLPLLVVFSIVVGACDSSSGSISLTASETVNARQAYGFAQEGEDIEMDSPTLRVAVGQPVTVNLENNHGQYYGDSEAHDFAVIADKDAPRGEWVYLWDSQTEAVAPGGQGAVTFTPDTSGTFFYVCTLVGHARKGMWGEFVVES